MRWDGWGIYALLALLVSTLATAFTPLPGEGALVDAFRALYPAGGLWDGLEGIVKDQMLCGALVLVVTFALYLVLPPREAVVPLAGVMGALAIEWVLKPLVQRPRPGIAGMLGATGFSFPSGQALYYAAWLGAIAVVCSRRLRSSLVRKIVVAVLLAVAGLGGIARLAVGAHWFTDVAGAWLWATAWVLWLRNATR